MAFLLFSKKYFYTEAGTHCGLKRNENQDTYRCCPDQGLFVISDGMGGGEGGRRAAEIVAGNLERAAAMPMKHLSNITRFAHQANAEILDYAKVHNLRGMGATIVGIVLSAFHPEQGLLFSAGDSRCYRLRNDVFEQLTTDHTIASAMGVKEEKLAKHLQGVLTNVTGCGASFFLETRELEICSKDRYLICTDGIYRQISDSELKRILVSAENPQVKVQTLIDKSLEAGGVDNATAIVLEFGSLPEITPEIVQEEAACPEDEEKGVWDDVTPPTE